MKEDSPINSERGDFKAGDRVLFLSGNGQVIRRGRIIRWDTLPDWAHTARKLSGKTGHWFVEIEHDPQFGKKPNGFRTWFDANQLVKEV